MISIGCIPTTDISASKTKAEAVCPTAGFAISPWGTLVAYVRTRAKSTAHPITVTLQSVAADNTKTTLSTLETYTTEPGAADVKRYEVPNSNFQLTVAHSLLLTVETAGESGAVETTANVYIQG